MKKRVNYFSAEGYRRLARNPFIDQKTLQFIRRRAPADAAVTPSEPGRKRRRGTSPRSPEHLVMSEEAARLIAAALKGFLNE